MRIAYFTHIREISNCRPLHPSTQESHHDLVGPLHDLKQPSRTSTLGEELIWVIPRIVRSVSVRSKCPKDPSVLKIVRRSNPYYLATAVVFSGSVPFWCLFFLEKQALLSPLRSVLQRPYRICSPYRNSLSVLFLVREGPLGGGAW